MELIQDLTSMQIIRLLGVRLHGGWSRLSGLSVLVRDALSAAVLEQTTSIFSREKRQELYRIAEREYIDIYVWVCTYISIYIQILMCHGY